MSREDQENGLQSWIVTASGYPGQRVIWIGQDTTRPSDDFVTMRWSDQVTEGAFDQIDYDTDLTRPAGQEVQVIVTGWREFTLYVDCYTHAATGSSSAHAVLTRCQTQLALPSIRDILDAAGLGPSFTRGTITMVPQILGTSRFEAHGRLDVNFLYTDIASEFTTYIAEVDTSGTIGDVDGNVPASGNIVVRAGP